MEFLHPTDFPLTVVTDFSHGVDVDVEIVEIGVVLVTAFAPPNGMIS
jgi:hypothetical protein